ncbi:MAG: O-antigen ligase family protein [Bacteroidales bacterium]|nr:O-antigen ligase family protein [Bacteroidales bacterium]
MLWTDDTNNGNNLIIKTLPLSAIPLSIVLGKACGYIKNIKWLLAALVAGTIAADICNLYLSYQDCWYDVDGQSVFFSNPYMEDISIWESINQGYSNFSYTWLSHFGHPSYISLYGLFSIAVLYYSIRNNSHSIAVKILLATALVFCLAMVYLLNSRANLIALMFLLICILAYEIGIKKKYVLPVIILAAGITGGTFVFGTGRGESLKSKVSNIQEQTEQSQSYKGIDVRLDIWIEACQVIKKYPIWGTGIGDGDNALMGQYLIDGCSELYENEYVTHNQFLDVQMTRGIMGTITLLALFIIPFAAAIRRRDFVLMTLVIIMAVNCIFENMLNRSGGFMFYPLMTALLLVADRKYIANETKQTNDNI